MESHFNESKASFADNCNQFLMKRKLQVLIEKLWVLTVFIFLFFSGKQPEFCKHHCHLTMDVFLAPNA